MLAMQTLLQNARAGDSRPVLQLQAAERSWVDWPCERLGHPAKAPKKSNSGASAGFIPSTLIANELQSAIPPVTRLTGAFQPAALVDFSQSIWIRVV